MIRVAIILLALTVSFGASAETVRGALDVSGGAVSVLSAGNTSGTNALVVQNSDTDNLLTVRDDGELSGEKIQTAFGGSSVWIGSGGWATESAAQHENVMIGPSVAPSFTGGYYNSCVGPFACNALTSGTSNVAFGRYALSDVTNTNYNVAIGPSAGENYVGGSSVLIGAAAGKGIGADSGVVVGGFALATSTQNPLYQITAVGGEAGRYATTPHWSTFVGHSAGHYAAGYANVFIGGFAGANSTSHNNVVVGRLAGTSIAGNNTIIGVEAGDTSTGSGNVFIGYQAGDTEAGSNKLYISNQSDSTPLIYGDFSTDALTFNGSVEVDGAVWLPYEEALTAAGPTLTCGMGAVDLDASSNSIVAALPALSAAQDTTANTGCVIEICRIDSESGNTVDIDPGTDSINGATTDIGLAVPTGQTYDCRTFHARETEWRMY